MFPFRRDSKPEPEQPEEPEVRSEAPPHPLDALTGGVFSAETSAERAQRLERWLAGAPAEDALQEVYKALSGKDKGVAKLLRERLDEFKHQRQQQALAQEWEQSARTLLQVERLNIADGMAWERDAAAAGAPLSREPLSGLRQQLAQRVAAIDELQQRAMVQREAGALLAQRIEMLSAKSWTEASERSQALAGDVGDWGDQLQALVQEVQWPSVDLRHSAQLESAQQQLDAVWTAFSAALAQARAAAEDASAPLPDVPMWAQELRAARSGKPEPEATEAARDDGAAARSAAIKAVEAGTRLLEQAVAAGQTKDMHSATQALRQALKKHGRHIAGALEARVHAALVSAGELQGWQRWSADQAREKLVARAEALLKPRARKGKGKDRNKDQGKAAAIEPTDAASAPVAAAEAPPAAPEAEAAMPEAAAQAPTAEVQQAPVAASQTGPEIAASQADAFAAVQQESAPEEETGAPAAASEDLPPLEPTGAADAPAGDVPDPAAVPEAASVESDEPAVPEAAEGIKAPAAAAGPAESTEADQPAAPEELDGANLERDWEPTLKGRQLQEAIHKLRRQWKTADKGGAPNHALWKRFDDACNRAYHFVQIWLQQVQEQNERHHAQRLGLIEQVEAWARDNPGAGEVDWKAFNQAVRRFSQRWRSAGHVSEKLYAQLQPRWKAAIHAAAQPLEQAQKASTERRRALIEEARVVAAQEPLPIPAVRDLQRRWQAEARTVPLVRRREEKLWKAFRAPMDEAFQRKDAQRKQERAAQGARDQRVLDAAEALEQANRSGDAQRIQEAIAHLETVTQAVQQGVPPDAAPQAAVEAGATDVGAATAEPPTDHPAEAEEEATAPDADAAAGAEPGTGDEAGPDPAEAPADKPRRVVAVRGDDRPGARGRGSRAARERQPERGQYSPRGRRERGSRRSERGERRERLSDSAWRAQRAAVEQARGKLRELAVQAHGEALTDLLAAWQKRSADDVPAADALGRAVPPATAREWAQAVGAAAGDAAPAGTALLRLEEAAGLPSPAAQLDARRALKLHLLTHRDEPGPDQTWAQDTQAVLASGYDGPSAERLRKALKVLLGRG